MRTLLLACCAPLLAACFTRTSFTPTNAAPKPIAARAPETVVMYTLGLPERPYTEIGVVSASGIRWSAGAPSALAALRRFAARRGCDGVIVMGPDDKLTVSTKYEERTSGETRAASRVGIERGATLGYHGEVRSTYRGTCIVHL